jgi:hypothetical protein
MTIVTIIIGALGILGIVTIGIVYNATISALTEKALTKFLNRIRPDLKKKAEPAPKPCNLAPLFCIVLTNDKIISPVEIEAESDGSTINYRTLNRKPHTITKDKVKKVAELKYKAHLVLEHHHLQSNYGIRIYHDNGRTELRACSHDDAWDKMDELIEEKAKDGILIEREFKEEDVPPRNTRV